MMEGSSFRLSWPSASLFKFPPASLPEVVPAPDAQFTYATPFQIPQNIYNNLLSVVYPLTTAIVYVAAVNYMNRVNQQRNNQPWPVSKTWAFYIFVLLHNIFLAAYSGWTFNGMWQALKHSWPGWHGTHSVADVADAMCKIHGPRGRGYGVAYNSTTNIWTSPNVAINLTPKGTPDTTDLGRLWNEGLGFYGWLFYLSKFYEVLDTAIVLAKGKTSSNLQGFHHAGALLSLWAGIRYMSPPVWVWVLFNSAIHTVMYTYYALTAVSVPVPKLIKRIITTLQISQFVLGAIFALAHLFVFYSVPVSVPASVVSSVASAVSAAPSVASSVASSAATSIASAASSVGLGNIFRKVALRAAGQEGLAENVPLNNEKPMLKGMGSSVANKMRGVREEVTYTTEDQMIPCIDTSGQVFAISLNLLYLLPLTYLFVRFFTQSYSNRTSSDTRHPTQHGVLGKAGRDAAKGIGRELEEKPVPLPEQTKTVAKVATKTAERLVKELEREVDEAGNIKNEEMPGSYDGQDQMQGQKTRSGDKEDGKPEQEITVNGNVTKEQQNDSAREERSAPGHDDANSKDEPANDEPKKKSDDDERKKEKSDDDEAAAQAHAAKPSSEVSKPTKDIEKVQDEMNKAIDEADGGEPSKEKAKQSNGDAKPGADQSRPTKPSSTDDDKDDAKDDDDKGKKDRDNEEAKGKEEEEEDDGEGDSDKENRPSSSTVDQKDEDDRDKAGAQDPDQDGKDDDADGDDDEREGGVTTEDGIYQPTTSDIDHSMVVVNGNPDKEDAEERDEKDEKDEARKVDDEIDGVEDK